MIISLIRKINCNDLKAFYSSTIILLNNSYVIIEIARNDKKIMNDQMIYI